MTFRITEIAGLRMSHDDRDVYQARFIKSSAKVQVYRAALTVFEIYQEQEI